LLQFLLFVKASTLEQQMSKPCPHILSTEASYHIYASKRPITNIKEFSGLEIIFCRPNVVLCRYEITHTLSANTNAATNFLKQKRWQKCESKKIQSKMRARKKQDCILIDT